FRYKNMTSLSSWHHLHAPKRDAIVDTCGAGDWATAGLIEMTCQNGMSNLMDLSKEKILNALTFAQKLGSWNCGFAGARGAMYSMSKSAFLSEIRALAHPTVLTLPTVEGPNKELDGNPACRMCNSKLRVEQQGRESRRRSSSANQYA